MATTKKSSGRSTSTARKRPTATRPRGNNGLWVEDTNAASERAVAQLMTNLFGRMETEVRQNRKDAAEQLNNAFMSIVAVQQPTVETVLFVLEMIRHQIITSALSGAFGPGSTVKVERPRVGTSPAPEELDVSAQKTSALGASI